MASDVTFVADPNIVAKAQANLATTKSDLPLVVNDYVATFINFFANTQRATTRSCTRFSAPAATRR